ncbi:hypothetical protein Acsp06_28280 [Actinomycetospora sp. NBRC 106375]|uniref:hypothetical protein n=1 Tax=Actinomycetospora sp. NBRC 106375 TaxID=3032207 RepID=UPI0024A44AF3|nr:hypothetical protein [Actinomycetospora sp. NBRC 106375]GLZ46643.1 hypothetical protein Acsp06_28280 [Actinomycetospora sp. NBRC 106375]
MRIRLDDGPCQGDHDLTIAEGANLPEEFLVLVEQGPRQKVSDMFGGSIPGINVFAVHRLARRDGDGTPVYAFAGRRESRGY